MLYSKDDGDIIVTLPPGMTLALHPISAARQACSPDEDRRFLESIGQDGQRHLVYVWAKESWANPPTARCC